jgi:biuret amidohydrolase
MTSAYGLEVPMSLPEICQPERTAALIYDMQVGIVSQIDNGDQIVKGCEALLAAARAGGCRVFYTRHIFLPHQSAGVGQLRRAMIWQRQEDPLKTQPAYLPSSEAAQIAPQLRPLETDVVVDKITMSAFEGTYLNLALRDLRMQSIIIAGIALEVGIEPSIRHALDLNYIPVVVSDLCGSRTRELHQRSLEALKSTGEVLVVSSEELIPHLSAHQ